jgi:hypothetical protein
MFDRSCADVTASPDGATVVAAPAAVGTTVLVMVVVTVVVVLPSASVDVTDVTVLTVDDSVIVGAAVLVATLRT